MRVSEKLIENDPTETVNPLLVGKTIPHVIPDTPPAPAPLDWGGAITSYLKAIYNLLEKAVGRTDVYFPNSFSLQPGEMRTVRLDMEVERWVIWTSVPVSGTFSANVGGYASSNGILFPLGAIVTLPGISREVTVVNNSIISAVTFFVVGASGQHFKVSA